jgi:predicted nucleic acid-binding protein
VTSYVDSSAILKRYVDEPDSDLADELLADDRGRVTARHTVVEVRRNLGRLLTGTALSESRAAFATDLESFAIVELDAATCELAATIAEQTGARTLDALHLGAARRLGTALTFVTFDVRQAQTAPRGEAPRGRPPDSSRRSGLGLLGLAGRRS